MEHAISLKPSCLIVEDEVVVGSDLEERIDAAGFNVEWVATAESAEAILTKLTPDIVILDVMVRAKVCTGLARELKRRGIPFVVHSGYAPREGHPDFQGAPWLSKPVETSAMLATLNRTLGAARSPTTVR